MSGGLRCAGPAGCLLPRPGTRACPRVGLIAARRLC
jgi:hypothetical protein